MGGQKIIIYQTFTRTFGNQTNGCLKNGSLKENGVGKMNDFTPEVLQQIKQLGANHIWYTGIIRHATTTDYTAYGIPCQNANIVKGRAGSPYAITDYYDIDPDIATDVDNRMKEFEALIERSHKAGLKVIVDFVPNHVARQYQSICKPAGTTDLGEDDDKGKHFDAQNNFYYCPNTALDLSRVKKIEDGKIAPYAEYPAKCTGNDRFDASPEQNDWYETIKLNYGVDYCDAGGCSHHFFPTPSTWKKMTEILRFWASKGIDGFRCDMAEMVPEAFWHYATQALKAEFPNLIFIGEVYNPALYRNYIAAGFDYLYDKVGLYDCVREVICHHRPAHTITQAWQQTNDIKQHLLYFLENHDEQRIASDFFAGKAERGVPGMIVSALFQTNPVMVYAGQEFGERGMDEEGFSGKDGRSTIFDYWRVEAVYKGFFNRKMLSRDAAVLESTYQRLLTLCNEEMAVCCGATYDLMYANGYGSQLNPDRQFAFLRKYENELLLIVANFDEAVAEIRVKLPTHAFDFLEINECETEMTDLLSNETITTTLKKDGAVLMSIPPYSGRIYKCCLK